MITKLVEFFRLSWEIYRNFAICKTNFIKLFVIYSLLRILNNNQITGIIPEEFGKLSNLNTLYLFNYFW